MITKAEVYRNGIKAGILIRENRHSFIFRYTGKYFSDPKLPAVSLTLPKIRQEYRSSQLFPFFFNMLSEGVNKELQCRQLKIDENDYFGLLLAIAQYDTVGAVSVQPVKEETE